MSDTSAKTHKLASAIYLITSFFSDLEPLKWRLRTLSTDLISENLKDKPSILKEALSCFAIAKNAGLVSEANSEILIRELSKLRDEFEKPIEISFPTDLALPERALNEPQRTDRIKDNIVKEERKTDERPPVLKDFGAVSVKKNSRQSIIISLLKRKKEVMIKDVSPLISGCSEKTIQRELLAMVQAGILKKVGEKRWSRYSLA